MSILIALVIGGIILIMVASVNDATLSNGAVVVTAVPVSPLVTPAGDAAPVGQNSGGQDVSGQSTTGGDGADGLVGASSNGDTSAGAECADGCLLDNMCGGGESIVARYDPVANTRYYYPPDHSGYQAFRTAETQGEINYYFCSAAQAEALNWRKAP